MSHELIALLMFSSMLLTLLIVPVLYLMLDDAAEWMRALPAKLRGRRAHPVVAQEGTN